MHKIEVYRPSLEMPLLAKQDSSIIALASDATINMSIPVLTLNNISQMANFIRTQFNLH
ncbi:MAG: molybdopterin-guanine dinucleotide biosynthesis protein B [Methylophilaceae bacterium]